MLNDKTPLLLHLRWGSETYLKHHWVFKDKNDCKSNYFPATSWSLKLFNLDHNRYADKHGNFCQNKHPDHMMTRGISIRKVLSRMLHTKKLTKQQQYQNYTLYKHCHWSRIYKRNFLRKINLPYVVLKIYVYCHDLIFHCMHIKMVGFLCLSRYMYIQKNVSL